MKHLAINKSLTIQKNLKGNFILLSALHNGLTPIDNHLPKNQIQLHKQTELFKKYNLNLQEVINKCSALTKKFIPELNEVYLSEEEVINLNKNKFNIIKNSILNINHLNEKNLETIRDDIKVLINSLEVKPLKIVYYEFNSSIISYLIQTNADNNLINFFTELTKDNGLNFDEYISVWTKEQMNRLDFQDYIKNNKRRVID